VAQQLREEEKITGGSAWYRPIALSLFQIARRGVRTGRVVVRQEDVAARAAAKKDIAARNAAKKDIAARNAAKKNIAARNAAKNIAACASNLYDHWRFPIFFSVILVRQHTV
jgi:hypothetical protein